MIDDPSLVGGGDCTSHYHSSDRNPNHDTLSRLQQLASKKTVSGNYACRASDDYVFCDTASTITLPPSKNGQEIHVTQTTANNLTVIPAGLDTICGTTSVSFTVQWMSLHFKAVDGGWVII